MRRLFCRIFGVDIGALRRRKLIEAANVIALIDLIGRE